MAEWRDPERINQTEFGDGIGNCYSACIAMLLRLPLSEAPNFNTSVPDAMAGETRRRAIVTWLQDRGWSLHSVWSPDVAAAGDGVINRHGHWGRVQRHTHFPWPPARGFYIASGLSPRDTRHSVVYKDGALWHDPHPDGGGLTVVDYVDFLRPLYPAGLQRIP